MYVNLSAAQLHMLISLTEDGIRNCAQTLHNAPEKESTYLKAFRDVLDEMREAVAIHAELMAASESADEMAKLAKESAARVMEKVKANLEATDNLYKYCAQCGEKYPMTFKMHTQYLGKQYCSVACWEEHKGF